MVQDHAVPIPLTNIRGGRGRSLTTLEVEYIDDLPEYPTSHIHGHSYIIASMGRRQSEMEQLVQGVSEAPVLGRQLDSTC